MKQFGDPLKKRAKRGFLILNAVESGQAATFKAV